MTSQSRPGRQESLAVKPRSTQSGEYRSRLTRRSCLQRSRNGSPPRLPPEDLHCFSRRACGRRPAHRKRTWRSLSPSRRTRTDPCVSCACVASSPSLMAWPEPRPPMGAVGRRPPAAVGRSPRAGEACSASALPRTRVNLNAGGRPRGARSSVTSSPVRTRLAAVPSRSRRMRSRKSS